MESIARRLQIRNKIDFHRVILAMHQQYTIWNNWYILTQKLCIKLDIVQNIVVNFCAISSRFVNNTCLGKYQNSLTHEDLIQLERFLLIALAFLFDFSYQNVSILAKPLLQGKKCFNTLKSKITQGDKNFQYLQVVYYYHGYFKLYTSIYKCNKGSYIITCCHMLQHAVTSCNIRPYIKIVTCHMNVNLTRGQILLQYASVNKIRRAFMTHKKFSSKLLIYVFLI